MAFVGVFSDLFNCGRPRKPQTRDGPSETNFENVHDARRDVTVDPAPNSLGATDDTYLDTTTAPVLDEIDQHPFARESIDLKVEPPKHKEDTDDVAPTEPDAIRDHKNVLDDVTQKRGEHHEGPGDEGTKDSKGWLVEKRIIVTADSKNTTDGSPVFTSESKPQDDSQPFSVATIDTKLHGNEPFKPEVEPEDNGRELSEAIETAPVVLQTKLVENDEPVSITTTIPATQEIIPSSLPTNEEETSAVASQKATPMQFLGLPSEIRKAIYERLTEAKPIRMCRHDDPALTSLETEPPCVSKRQYYALTQVCHTLRTEFLPIYEQKTEYIIDLWAQKGHLTKLNMLKGSVAMDIDAACFDMAPIDLLPLIRYLARTGRTNVRFASTEGVVFRSIESIVTQLNQLLPSPTNTSWLAAVNGPMKRIDLHLFPHEDIRAYYRFRGAEPMLRIVYPGAAIEGWMKQAHKSGGEYEAYLEETGLVGLDMHVVVGHASRRTTNEGRLPLDWRLSYVGSRLSLDQAVRISGTFAR